jgi:hypothetical protein
MGNLEKPLTWGLTILLLGYLFVANCKCGEESACQLNNGFNISNTDINVDVLKVDAPETVEEVKVEAIIIDSDTTIVAETNIDSSEAEIEAKVEIEE